MENRTSLKQPGKGDGNMKRILMASVALFITAGVGIGVWADEPAVKPGERLTRDQAVQLRDAAKQKHQKKGNPDRKIEGKAAKGARKVSPDPVKKTNN